MPRGAYARPPITEAVIDIRIENPLTPAELQKLKGRFSRQYPNSEEQIDWNVGFGPDATGRLVTQTTEIGRWYKLTSDDQADILALRNQNLSTSRLSPYQGWDAFFAVAKKNYQIWRRTTGYKPIARIATRYINRVDIPAEEFDRYGIEGYFVIAPALPAERRASQFFTQATFKVEEIDATAIFNFGSVPSPLLDHVSFVLDTDLYRDDAIPTRGMELWAMISKFREYKNSIFEDSLTDRARDLFDAG
jgi:uncharacterized protein (TIGR04255 family)